MRNLSLFLLEWKHFVRSPFKVVALVLFVVAGAYGLQQGANLCHQQIAQIENIEANAQEERQAIIDEHYRKGVLTPEDQPWIDYSTPFWAIWWSYPYHFKQPSPAMVYSVGQSEQYGFYKRITFWSSPYDTDLAEEIANPERLQTGTLDFSFALLFLLPLVLLVLTYNVKSMETEQGFMPLVEVQMPASSIWLLLRMSFYVLLLLVVTAALLLYGARLTNVHNGVVGQILWYGVLYLAFWSVLYFFILATGKSILGNTLKMSAVYLLFAFLVPAAVQQALSIGQPANLMTDFIDVRDQQEELFAQPDSVYQAQLNALFPAILDSPVYQDSNKIGAARSRSAAALVNQLKKASIQPIDEESKMKNTFIGSTFWFNPISFFQNRLNRISQTHFEDYQAYRTEIQTLIDQQINRMVIDMWNEVQVDEQKYLEYSRMLAVD